MTKIFNMKTARTLNESLSIITPKLAKKISENNPKNRKFRLHVAQDYARQMRLNRWGKSPEAIVLTKSGILVNGQHRIWAIIETGISCTADVVVIEDKDFDSVFEILDQGASRSASDILKIDSKQILPINYLLRCAGLQKPKPQDIKAYIESPMGEILSQVCDLKLRGKVWKHTGFKAAVTISILSGGITKERAFEVLKQLNSGSINDWPPIFSQLYIQLTDPGKQLKMSGRSFDNDWFTRSVYSFVNVDKPTKIIRLSKSFNEEVKNMSMAALYAINPDFLE